MVYLNRVVPCVVAGYAAWELSITSFMSLSVVSGRALIAVGGGRDSWVMAVPERDARADVPLVVPRTGTQAGKRSRLLRRDDLDDVGAAFNLLVEPPRG